MSRFISYRFADLEAYTPGEQPRDMQYIKLNTNESPFPPSPQVLAAVNTDEAAKYNLYSDPECRVLRQKVAALYDVKDENVFLSNGSDDILNFFFMSFCDDERPVAFPEISYGFYQVYADLYRLPHKAIPLREDFTLNAGDYYGLNSNIVIANPNAPTGLSISVAEIEKMLQTNPDHVVLIDEAYVDFGGESCYPLIHKYDNLLVCRTFSKSWSMAGARLGYAFGSAGLIEDLNKIKFSTNPYSINRLTLAAGIAAVDSYDYFKANCQTIMEVRTYFTESLSCLGFETLPSLCNFVFTRHPNMDGQALYDGLRAKGVLVRHWNNPKIKDYLRITIGTQEQMETVVKKLEEILKGE